MPPRYAPLAIFALSLALFMANGREVSAPDTLPTRYLPLRLLRGSVDLAPIPFFEATRGGYWTTARGAAIYSPSPIGTAVLATPLYAPFVLAGVELDESGVDRLSKLAAALLVAAGAAALACSRLPNARLAAILFACASPAWSIASQGLWMHTGATPALAAALALATRGRPGLAGILAGIAVACRPSVAPAVGVFGLVAYLGTAPRAPRDLFKFAAGPVAFAALVAVFDIAVFGRPFGGHPAFSPTDSAAGTGAFGSSLFQGTAGLLVSPSRGLLFFAPCLLLGLGTAAAAIRAPAIERPEVRWYRAAVAAALAMLLIHAKFRAWWGGWSYGPRYLTDAAPFLAALAAPALAALWQARSLRPLGPLAAGILVAWSVAAQAVGAFCFIPEVWNRDVDVDNHPERAFDLRRSQIAAAIAHGPVPRGFFGHEADTAVAWWSYDRGRIDEARRLAVRARERNPRSPRPDTLLGRIAAGEGDIERARAHFVRALAIDPSYAPAAIALEMTRER